MFGSELLDEAERNSAPAVPVGHSRYFTDPEQDPACWEYSQKNFYPVNIKYPVTK